MTSPSSPKWTAQDGLAAEYTTLRDEINSNSLVAAQMLTIAFTAAAAFITFGLQAKTWSVFFAPVVLITVLAVFVTSQYDSTVRISAYICLRYDRGEFTDSMWEPVMRYLRQRSGNDRPIITVWNNSYVLSLTATFVLLNLTSCALSIYFFVLEVGSPIDNLLSLDMSDAFCFAVILLGGWALLLLTSFVVVGKLQNSFSSKRFDRHYQVLKNALAAVEQIPSTPS
jgi:hypothetical protein